MSYIFLKIFYVLFKVDLGNEKIVHAVATQGMSSQYTLTTYSLTYSLDGNRFLSVTNGTAQMVSCM